MYRTVQDFINDWEHAAKGTEEVLQAVTDEKSGQAIVEGHSTLRWLSFHLATSPAFFAGLAGLDVKATLASEPNHVEDSVKAYQEIVADVKQAAENNLSDEALLEEVDGNGGKTPRGAILRILIDHQTHHRGQMTVLLRQAGLPVPGIMGPTKEQQS
ncbi:DinB family protein [Gracilibacillus alcaliphilus]|uniref:DinB family protein n=1 Tax=Gracilibacillus alcaliphilus TaxID=1401441 RepID=UPI00195891BC|nr:DinB family protein [Gracilibacillus alcaliphilus]MBM7677032.1 putative damage-inducible protein DinB [Gracilibacillus alcaliphilus]